jgi:hypothetical protein
MITKFLLLALFVFAAFTQQAAGAAGSNEFDIDESQANTLISSLFKGNTAAVNAIQSTASAAPKSAPQGASISASAPTAVMKAQGASTTALRSSSLIGGIGGYGGYPGDYVDFPGDFIGGPARWGRYVRTLRCSYQSYGSGFCCRWVWTWRYW